MAENQRDIEELKQDATRLEKQEEVVEAARALVSIQVLRQARQPDIDAFYRLQVALGALEGGKE